VVFPPETGQSVLVFLYYYVVMSAEIFAFMYTGLRMWLFQDSLGIGSINFLRLYVKDL